MRVFANFQRQLSQGFLKFVMRQSVQDLPLVFYILEGNPTNFISSNEDLEDYFCGGCFCYVIHVQEDFILVLYGIEVGSFVIRFFHTSEAYTGNNVICE